MTIITIGEQDFQVDQNYGTATERENVEKILMNLALIPEFERALTGIDPSAPFTVNVRVSSDTGANAWSYLPGHNEM